jgi:hypothetical protein
LLLLNEVWRKMRRAEGSEPERERIRNGRRATRGERETEID